MRSRFSRIATCCLLLGCLFPGSAYAEDTCKPVPEVTCATVDLVTRALNENGPATEGPVLLFDHTEQKWHGCRYVNDKNGQPLYLDCSKKNGEIDENNKLQMDFEAGERPRIFVIETNPLLYDVDADATTLVKNPDEEVLAQFLSLLASTATGVLRAAGADDFHLEGVAPPPAPDPEKMLRTAQVWATEAGTNLQPQVPAASAGYSDEQKAFVDELRKQSLDLIHAVGPQVEELKKQTGILGVTLAKLEENGREILADGVTIRRQLRLIESQDAKAELLAPRVTSWDAWDTAVAELQTAKATAAKASLECADALNQMANLLKLSLVPLPGPGEPARFETQTEFRRLVKSLEDNQVDASCGDATQPIHLIVRILDGVTFPGIDARPIERGRYGNDDLSQVLQALRAYLDRLPAATGEHAALLAKAKTALEGQAAASDQLTANLFFLDRQKGYTDASQLTHGILERPLYNREPVDVDWGQSIDSAVKIKAVAALKEAKIPSTRPAEVTASYRLTRKSFTLGLEYDFALVHTTVGSPVYEAVEVPDPDAAPGADGMAKTKKVIRQVDEESRSGDAALFLTLTSKKSKEFFTWGGQLGFSLDTEEPAALVGLSFRFGKYFALSGGYGYYQVKELKNLTVGQTIESTEAIATRNDFKGGAYLALAITINDLAVFKPKE